MQSGILGQVAIESGTAVTVVSWAVLIAGIGILTYWLLLTRFGTEALRDIPRRRTKMPFFVPVCLLVAWYSVGVIVVGLATLAKEKWGVSEANAMAGQYVGMSAVDAGFIGLMCWLGYTWFSRRLRGYGLRFRHLWSDFWRAGATLLAVLPVVAGLVQVVLVVGQYFYGPDFKMQENEGITDLLASSQWWLKAVIVIFAGVIVPVYEEMLFRGLFQSVLRCATGRPWASIAATSGLFAALHPAMHWPALFVLSLAIGYSYEKSGSLTRAILVHMMFNCTMLTMALGQ